MKRWKIRMDSKLKLSNGNFIPVIGFSAIEVEESVLQRAIYYAMDLGYRHFDCSWFYGNENIVGSAIQEKIKQGVVKRDELFITTKLWNNHHAKKKVVPMIKESLTALNLTYVDLYLMHWPFGFTEKSSLWPDIEGPEAYSDVDYLETWQAMEECVKLGLARSIGVGNFNSEQLSRLYKSAQIKPVVNYIEVHPKLNQSKLIKFCKDLNITVIGYHPLGTAPSRNHTGVPLSAIFDPKVEEIGNKYSKTPSQVVLCYLVSFGICIVPKSSTKAKLLDYTSIFDFKLSEEETAYLDSCNKNARIEDAIEFKNHKYYPFKKEF